MRPFVSGAVRQLLFAAVFVAIVVATWPTPPWSLLEYGGIAMMIIAPLLFYPFTKSLFLAFDLVSCPAGREDRAPSPLRPHPR